MEKYVGVEAERHLVLCRDLLKTMSQSAPRAAIRHW